MSTRKPNPDQTDLFETDTQSYRYLVLLNPGFHIAEKVKFFREKLSAVCELREEDLHSKPHITLCFYDSAYKCDELIVEKVREVASNTHAFDVQVNGVDYWQSGTFFLKLYEPSPVLALTRDLKAAIKGVQAGTHPHITVVRKLKKQHYVELDEADFDFRLSAPCSSITVLKQLLDGKHPYEVLEKVKLKSRS